LAKNFAVARFNVASSATAFAPFSKISKVERFNKDQAKLNRGSQSLQFDLVEPVI
jgi:hypothetical protein